MEQFISKKKSLNCRGKLLSLDKPLVMGILNITPDSFYDGNRYINRDNIFRRIENILQEGADIVDIGAYSSRPGADNIAEKEELNRLIPALEIIRNNFPEAIVSVDTFRANIAKAVIENFDVEIINDISGGELDSKMVDTVAQYPVSYIAMHMRGNPQTMQNYTNYKDIVNDLIEYFARKINHLKKSGIKDLIIDPGFGFSKTLEQNYEILKKLELFQLLEHPVLVGISRKSMIYKYLGISPENSLNGTSILNTIALLKNADILRVHDVKEAVEAVKLLALIK